MGGLRLRRYAKAVFEKKLAMYCLAFLLVAVLAGGCGGSGGTSLQLEPTFSVVASPSPPLITPTPTAGPATPQPTQTSTVDTSDWPTFSSDLGFDIKYPPDWTVLEPQQPGQKVVILNPKADAERVRRVSEGITEFPTLQAGEAWIEVGPGPQEPFDVDALSTICTGSTKAITFKGLRAAECQGKTWVEKLDGSIIRIARVNIGLQRQSSDLLDAILATVSFSSNP